TCGTLHLKTPGERVGIQVCALILVMDQAPETTFGMGGHTPRGCDPCHLAHTRRPARQNASQGVVEALEEPSITEEAAIRLNERSQTSRIHRHWRCHTLNMQTFVRIPMHTVDFPCIPRYLDVITA
uniref:hypothetical protein n=1 Tax=Deinococcus geothermalis TaxID=68909 RepID=UPI002354C18E